MPIAKSPFPRLLPASEFRVEHRLDGGPNHDGQGYGPFEYSNAPNVPPIDQLTWGVVMHTTETAGVPGYGVGVHPHFTYVPGKRLFVQHLGLDRRAATLKGTSTVENGLTVPTNRAKVIQVEIAAYSAWWIAAEYSRLAVRDLSDAALADLGRFVAWVHENSQDVAPLSWYPNPFPKPAKAMAHAKWVPLDGKRQWRVVDHGPAPDASDHWDAGDINRAAVIAAAKNESTMDGAAGFAPAKPSDAILDYLGAIGAVGPPLDYWKGLDAGDPDFHRLHSAVQAHPWFIRRVFEAGLAKPNEQWAIDYWQLKVNPHDIVEFGKFWAAVRVAPGAA